MGTSRLCSECGKPLPSDALPGLCPDCMTAAGLPGSERPTVQLAPGMFEAPAQTEGAVRGTKLGSLGDYELLEEVARGGMGMVYKARQTSLNRIVAVKMIRSGGLADEMEVARFHTEAQAAAQLQHPNIVAIHEIGEHEGRHYFSMDFVEGQNLAQAAQGKPIAPRQAAEWLKAIAEAVQSAHQRGVLHRDLKPQNIMVDVMGHPRVTDFGLAKNLAGDSTLTHTAAVMGSPSYMSPEQARGRNDLVGPASDVYSLGAILYELLTGRPPFRGKTLVETLSEVVNDEPRAPRKLNPGAPVDLETICLKCLEKEPVRRYPTARELELDLARFLADEPVQARPAGGLRKLQRWSRRHRWEFNVAVSLLVLSLMGLTYGLWQETRYQGWLIDTWKITHPEAVAAPANFRHEPIGRFFREISGLGPSSSRRDELWSLFWIEWIWFAVVYAVSRLGYRKLTPLGHPAAPWVALTFGTTAAIGVILALYLTATLVQVTVWEAPQSAPIWLIGGFALVFPLFASWFSMLLEVIRQQRRRPVDPGLEGAEAGLTPEELDSIHAALAARNIRRAAKHYRKATQVPFYEAEERVLQIAIRRLSAEDLAAIHQHIYAGRFHKAIKLFRAPTPESKTVAQKPILRRFRLSSRPAKMQKRFARQAVIQIAKQLYRAHPEKFAGGKPGGIKVNPAGRRWRWLGIALILSLVTLMGMGLAGLPPGIGSQFIVLLLAISAGAFLRIARWMEMYRERRQEIKLLLWMLFLLFGLMPICFEAVFWFRLLFRHTPPAQIDPGFDTYYPYLPGLIIGWLLMHLWLGRHKTAQKTLNHGEIARKATADAEISK